MRKSSRKSESLNGPKVLIFDIETKPIIAHVWSLWENNVALNQIQNDWHVMAWSAKWLGDPEDKIMYMDQRNAKNPEDDKKILKEIWHLLDEADIVITQNGRRFDQPKLFARFILNGLKKPSSFKHIDTVAIAKKHFAFTSNKLAYMTDKLNTKYKKLDHKKFPGHELWVECMKGNKAAWKEMEKYNKHDVLALEELYNILIPWSDNAPNFNLYREGEENTCKCGSKTFHRNGYHYTPTAKFQRFRCSKCRAETRNRVNELTKEKRQSLRVNVPS